MKMKKYLLLVFLVLGAMQLEGKAAEAVEDRRFSRENGERLATVITLFEKERVIHKPLKELAGMFDFKDFSGRFLKKNEEASFYLIISNFIERGAKEILRSSYDYQSTDITVFRLIEELYIMLRYYRGLSGNPL
jgi:hypothetical protein